MSWKTLTERFTNAEEHMNDPFAFESGVTVLAVPEKMMSQISSGAEKPEGITLNLPHVPSTHSVEVTSEPETFRGELPHLTPEEHETVLDWFDKQSCDPNNPLEVRTYLTEIALGLKLDAKKRIVPTKTSDSESGSSNE